MCGYTKRLSDGISGRLFEESTLGKCNSVAGGYVPQREALRLVRANQPTQKTRTVTTLEQQIAKLLGGRVFFYTAVRSALDQFHKIDGFFEFGDQMVTIDVTINDDKFAGKADLILRDSDFEDLSKLAQRIAVLLSPKRGERAGAANRTIQVWRAA